MTDKPIENEKLKAFMEKIREAVKKYQEKQEQEKKNLLEKLIQN